VNRIESTILRSLLYDDGYTRKVLPFIDDKYFAEPIEKTLFERVKAFVDKYNNLPTKEALVIDLNNASHVSQEEYDRSLEYLAELEGEKDTKPNPKWLVEQTESWCQERAIHNAVIEVINILDDKAGKTPKGGIPKLLQDALAVSFDPNVGHDYIDDAENRFEYYNRVDARLPFHLEWFNRVTKNGIPSKTLNIILAGVNVGKSLVMCDFASSYLAIGKNVLYITMEMAEEEIAKRIDAHLLDVSLDDLPKLERDKFISRVSRLRSKTNGKLIIKQYPTGSAHVGHFRHLLNELTLKKQFKPDVIIIDYLNICASSRVRAAANSYENVKSIAEELRGLAVEYDVPIWSATQTTRSGFGNNDPELTDTSESFGLPATADFMFALVVTDELYAQNQMLVKILKSRYGDARAARKFLVGVDRPKMRLYDLEESAQQGLTDAGKAIAKQASVEEDSTPPWGPDDDDNTPFVRKGRSGVNFGIGNPSLVKGPRKVLITDEHVSV
jgi:replicative DNA helicase